MKKLKFILTLLFLACTFLNFAQNRPEMKKVLVSGKIIDKTNKQPLEYATITLQNTKKAADVTGGITNAKGEFEFEVHPGMYDIKIEFISFKAIDIKQKDIQDNINFGTIALADDATQLNEVEIRTERTTVEIKLDKKVYNVGTDLMVKGGTVSDVLDNIPSVAVAQDGTISLRGNENVRILIDGKPSNAINITEALKQIPADAIDKVEVVTNPSARYDSEGGGGLLNIILKKGKNQGMNGSVIVSIGIPESYGVSANINYKREKTNVFTSVGYNYRNNPGKFITNSQYLNPVDGSTKNYIDERRDNTRTGNSYNATIGMDWFLDKSTTWTNALNVRKNNGQNPESVAYNYFDLNHLFQSTSYRQNDQSSNGQNLEYTTNFTKKFKKEGHKWTIDGSFSVNKDNDYALISDVKNEITSNEQDQKRNIIQSDYVLPFGNGSQFELGYKGDFSELTTAYGVGSVSNAGVYSPYANFTNTLEYKERVNALYSQLGTKAGKFSFLFGLRYENSSIDINLLTTNNFNKKRYGNLFPSAFLTYAISDKSSVSLSYSKRISRPRGRQINPFSNYSSNINMFQGNPDLNPALTDALDFGYLKRWEKLTFNTSMYGNRTSDSFQFIRRESGEYVNGTPVIVSAPINLATELRYGFEFTLNYAPYKWWKLNSNFNFFKVDTKGDYNYLNSSNVMIYQNFNNNASSWFARLTSKISLPYKIDWQTNVTYNGPQDNAQGRTIGVASANLGFSKDILKDKGTLALNVQDIFNSRKRIYETYLPQVNSYSEMQRSMRQITLSFTYRFNKMKGDKEKLPKQSDSEGGDFPG